MEEIKNERKHGRMEEGKEGIDLTKNFHVLEISIRKENIHKIFV